MIKAPNPKDHDVMKRPPRSTMKEKLVTPQLLAYSYLMVWNRKVGEREREARQMVGDLHTLFCRLACLSQ